MVEFEAENQFLSSQIVCCGLEFYDYDSKFSVDLNSCAAIYPQVVLLKEVNDS
jgi:hypothetical protein